jgi:quercetin dioxygenase-like cupin family protein
VDILHQGPLMRVPGLEGERSNLEISRVRIAPGASIPTHEHRHGSLHEMALGGGLLLQRRAVTRGTAFHWPREFPRRYDNPTDSVQTLLRVSDPALWPQDFADVPEPAMGLEVVAGRPYYPEADRGERG